jgi:hypothetical protein
METKHIIGFLVGTVLLVGVFIFFAGQSATSVLAAKYDMPAFAQCLKDKGAMFYGAFWCPHCGKTKLLFGSEAVKSLPYVECSTPDGKGQLPICKEKKIESYPTWEFANGSRLGGELAEDETLKPGMVTLGQLANATGCPVNALDGSVAIAPNMSPVNTASSTPTTASSTASTTSKVR